MSHTTSLSKSLSDVFVLGSSTSSMLHWRFLSSTCSSVRPSAVKRKLSLSPFSTHLTSPLLPCLFLLSLLIPKNLYTIPYKFSIPIQDIRVLLFICKSWDIYSTEVKIWGVSVNVLISILLSRTALKAPKTMLSQHSL